MNTRVYLITGFLGSGKTTLMKHLLDLGKGLKTGVIMNEFGREGIDGALLGSDKINLTEINNGSVFCTCRSDQFIEALVKMSSMGLDAIFIETSGMANPRGMGEILEITKKQSGYEYDYKGCIAIADATNIIKLMDVSPAVKDQLSYADLILINKTDLADEAALDSIENHIRNLNGKALIHRTSYSQLPQNFDVLLMKTAHVPDGAFTTAAESGVRKVSVKFTDSLPYEKFLKLLNDFSPITYRFKGFVELDGSDYIIDCVGSNISLEKTEGAVPGHYAEIISDSVKPLLIKFRKKYLEIMGEEPIAE